MAEPAPASGMKTTGTARASILHPNPLPHLRGRLVPASFNEAYSREDPYLLFGGITPPPCGSLLQARSSSPQSGRRAQGRLAGTAALRQSGSVLGLGTVAHWSRALSLLRAAPPTGEGKTTGQGCSLIRRGSTSTND